MADGSTGTPGQGLAERDRVAQVEARSRTFRKELGPVDLVLTQIMFIVGSGWVGTAAKLGPSHVVFWSLAILLYYLPQAAVVVFLNRQMPIEGGLYQWATVGLGDFFGFLTAWNLWAFAVTVIAVFGVMISTNVAYLLAPWLPGLAASHSYTLVVSVAAIVLMTVVSILGLRVGKWLQDIGGLAQFLTFGGLILAGFIALHRGGGTGYHPLDVAVPTFSLLSLNIFGKMALGAFSGFEYVALLAGECKDPARTIGRSVVIATPIIALMFILGTGSVLAIVPQDKIDLVSPIPQTLQMGFSGLGFVGLVAPLLILLLLLRQIGNVGLIFAGNTRLPMVTGWDGLLPPWFTRLHPRFKTPVNSILFVGALTLVLTVGSQIGEGLQETFQVLDNAAGILYAFAYLALFAIPLVGAHRLGVRPPGWLRAAAASGFVVTLLYSVLSIFPIIDVPSWTAFAARILTVLVTANVVGVAIYALGRARQRRRQPT